MASKRIRALRFRILYWLLLFFSSLAARLSLANAQRVGRGLGWVAWAVVGRQRRKAIANIARAFPEWTPARHADAIRKMFVHLGESLLEILWLPRFNAQVRDETTTLEGFDEAAKTLAGGRGVIAITGHCGNWEWLAHTVATFGSLTILHRERDEPEMNRFITHLRSNNGMHTIDRGSPSAAREMIKAVREGGMLAFLIDQNIRAESVKVPFFGIPALTPVGPARLAIRLEAPVILFFSERRNGRLVARALPAIETKRGDDPVALTAKITALIEEQIRRAPEQWVWMHDRWRERPQWDMSTRYAGGEAEQSETEVGQRV